MVKKIVGGFIVGVLLTACLIFGLQYLNSNDTEDLGMTGDFLAVDKTGDGTDASGTAGGSAATSNLKNSFDNLLLKVIELRDNKNDRVKSSKLVTEIEAIAQNAGNQPIIDKWESVALCLAKECSDENFLDFVSVIALEGEKAGIADASLIVNVLTANKYWKTDNTVKLSEAITFVNSAVEKLGDKDLSAKWTEFVACNADCENKNNLLFDLLRIIAK